MKRGTIYYDNTTGKLVSDKVWQMSFSYSDINPPIGEVVYAESSEKTREIADCPRDKRHITDCQITEVALGLFSGKALGDFVPAFGLPIISDRLAKRLVETDLTGYEVQPIVKIEENQSGLKHPKLFYLAFVGKGGRYTSRLRIKDAPNLCPHCGKEVMLCPACGFFNDCECIGCGKITVFRPNNPDYSHPKGHLIKWPFPETLIIEGKEWDGSDFFGGGCFVSNRCKEWLERTHTFPVAFKPALLNIEGAEDRFKGKK